MNGHPRRTGEAWLLAGRWEWTEGRVWGSVEAMSKVRKRREHPKPAGPRRRRLPPALAVAALAIGLVAVGAWWWNHALETEPLAMYEKLQGRWQRADGGYILDIGGVDAAGTLTARYFNPRPINVAKAEASILGETLRVFIELRDVNYPGSTYQLTYDQATDRLTGTYYQAALRESYDVDFTRLKP